ncbi:hypothetical protein R6Q59_018242 [Mikania micrantha]
MRVQTSTWNEPIGYEWPKQSPRLQASIIHHSSNPSSPLYSCWQQHSSSSSSSSISICKSSNTLQLQVSNHNQSHQP